MRSYLNTCIHSLNAAIFNYHFSFIDVLLTCHSHHLHWVLHCPAMYDVTYYGYHFNSKLNECLPIFSYFSIIVQFLLILSGDVEVNPGPDVAPNTTRELSSISILHQNIRSIRNKCNYIKNNFLDYDILCFTESKLSVDILDSAIILEGFDKFYRKDNSSNSGGLITYFSPHLISRRVHELENLLPESLWVEIT